MRILYAIGLSVALLSCTHTASGRGKLLPGYDADHQYYFHRTYIPDNSVQLGFSAGYSLYRATLTRQEDFRNGPNLTPAASLLHVGLLGEKGFLNMRLTVATGVYYSQLNSFLSGGWPSYKGAAYVVDHEDDLTVHYTSVNDVRSVASYVSVPVEVTFALVNDTDYGLYLKGSAKANVNLYATTKFITGVSTTEEVKQRLTSYFESVDPFFVNAHLKVGFRWGSFDTPNFRLEAGIPFKLSKSNTTYYQMNMGITAQIALYIPLFIFYG
ncbi:MAG: PorT family protein [Prevotellaceae bacterium]|nr:PorT family protein [Prevotellaceae bacterium]